MTIKENPAGTTMVLIVDGRLDTTTAPLLERKIKEVMPGILELVIDLSAVEYMSSAGLRVISLSEGQAISACRFSMQQE